MTHLRHAMSALVVGLGWAAAPAAATDEIILEWNEHLLDVIRVTDGIPSGYPGPISRCAAIVYTSVYDAVNSVAPTRQPYYQIVSCPAGTSAAAAAAAAAHHAMSFAYAFAPSQQAGIDALYATQLARIPDGPDKTAGIALGVQCAEAIENLRQGDGSDAPADYEPGAAPGDWVPTWPDYTAAATPQWPWVTPWCLTSGDQFRPDTCENFETVAQLLASPEYAAQFNEVKEIGAIASTTRTPYETETAFFWANCRNGTFKPPGHMLHIAQVLAEDHGLTLPEQARLFAMTAVASADAMISSWDTKFAMDIDLWRPITAIWEADTDGNPMTESEQGWLSLSFDPSYGAQGAFTPPFPGWTSGHALLSASNAAVWKAYFGTDDVTFTITSDDAPGVWRTYGSFTEAALEDGRSRVLFGVHFQWDSDAGYDVGTTVGEFIGANFFRRLGDLDGDGTTGVVDLLQLFANWGGTGDGDLNQDGIVDGTDFLLLLSAWG